MLIFVVVKDEFGCLLLNVLVKSEARCLSQFHRMLLTKLLTDQEVVELRVSRQISCDSKTSFLSEEKLMPQIENDALIYLFFSCTITAPSGSSYMHVSGLTRVNQQR